MSMKPGVVYALNAQVEFLMRSNGIRTQAELAARADMSPGTLRRILKTPHRTRLDSISKLSEALCNDVWGLFHTSTAMWKPPPHAHENRERVAAYLRRRSLGSPRQAAATLGVSEALYRRLLAAEANPTLETLLDIDGTPDRLHGILAAPEWFE